MSRDERWESYRQYHFVMFGKKATFFIYGSILAAFVPFVFWVIRAIQRRILIIRKRFAQNECDGPIVRTDSTLSSIQSVVEVDLELKKTSCDIKERVINVNLKMVILTFKSEKLFVYKFF